MKTIIILSIGLLLVGCGGPPVDQQAAQVCTGQGNAPGTAEYRECFNAVYPAIMNGRSRVAAARIAS